MVGLRCLALLLVSTHFLQIWGSAPDTFDTEDTSALNRVLEVEIEATEQQLELYQQKAELLRTAMREIQRQPAMARASNAQEFGLEATATQHRRPRSREAPQLFSDWFDPQGTFTRNSARVLTQLISFRPNASPVGRRQQMAARRRTNADDESPLQFLLVLDQDSTVLRLFHPTTFALMWQHALNLRSSSQDNGEFQVADMFFVSDRSVHLALLSTSGDLALFKLRLWHSRRIVAGDLRRLKPLRDLEENHLQCPAGQDSLNTMDAPQLPWLQQSSASLTSPATGKYLHVDVERVFGATLHHDCKYDRGKVAVVPLYSRVVVVASDNSGQHLSFFHGDNGTSIQDIRTQASPHDGGVVHLEPIQSSRGLVALATQRRVVFVDITAPRLVPVVCGAPGRHQFTSVAADPLRPTIFYAGTSTGRALVYKLHNLGAWRQRTDMSDREPRGPVACTLVDQLLPRRPPSPAFGRELPAVVQTLPGFLVLGVGSRLALYQLSASSENVQPTYLSERSLLDPFALALDGSSRPRILGVSAANDLVVHSTAFAVLVADANGSRRVDIYESRIPPPGTNLDLSWIRVPAMMVCALAAMFWQQKGRLVCSAGGRSGFNEAELAGLLSGRGGRVPSISSMKRGGINTNRRANDWY
ncbi:hypothetical protein PHYPSEUDO_005408 [Phytophthora pseudosyringae]|uniref:Uncharacterized protein n=1 Tax=Phytophthora pseudosyringae TaxID=221518 RepID=A0A8T1VRE9_9STRA|nr:hypothetical protein PHYPSEUDO_005408 [Phytophthora pseudosyringae]